MWKLISGFDVCLQNKTLNFGSDGLAIFVKSERGEKENVEIKPPTATVTSSTSHINIHTYRKCAQIFFFILSLIAAVYDRYVTYDHEKGIVREVWFVILLSYVISLIAIRPISFLIVVVLAVREGHHTTNLSTLTYGVVLYVTLDSYYALCDMEIKRPDYYKLENLKNIKYGLLLVAIALVGNIILMVLHKHNQILESIFIIFFGVLQAIIFEKKIPKTILAWRIAF